MPATRAILVTVFEPMAVGHGGNHRAYQIKQDLIAALGGEQVEVLAYREWLRSPRPLPSHWTKRLRGYRRKLRNLGENPLHLAGRTEFSTHLYDDPAFVAHYAAVAQKASRAGQVICLLEHTGFAACLEINRQLGIPTLACIQNLESLDHGILATASKMHMRARMLDLANELQVLARCDARLFISKVEASLVGGVGYPSIYYPYLPAGAVRERLLGLRAQRAAQPAQPGLMLMIGSASHASTRDAFGWLLQQVQRNGLPAGVELVVGGTDTDQLLPAGISIPGLSVRGRLPQEELDMLMQRVQAMLAPQLRGFGALTRLPEMACAGIPTLVSPHPTYALDAPPGALLVEDSWAAWRAAMTSLSSSRQAAALSLEEYLSWEQVQPNPLAAQVMAL